MYGLRVSCLTCCTLRVVSQPSTTMSACFQYCRSASMTAVRFFPPDWRCCWINQPIILLSLTPPGTPHDTCRPVAGLNLHPASHLRMPTLAQDAPAGRISQVTASDTLVIRLVFQLFWDSIQGWKKMEVLWGEGLNCWLSVFPKATLFTSSFKTRDDSYFVGAQRQQGKNGRYEGGSGSAF